jgi:hypothetical protein
MSEQQQAAGERTYGPCPCREAADALHRMFEIPPDVKQHLINSRIEFLKAIRTALDRRIDNLSAKGQQGTRVTVE